MTEADWLQADDPLPLLRWLRARAHGWGRTLLTWLGGGRSRDRRPRLLACACCRRIEPWLVEERLRRAVHVAELRAEGLAEAQELSEARVRAAESPWGGAARACACAAWEDAWAAALHAAPAALEAVAWHTSATPDSRAAVARERRAQADLVRDLFANPFRAVRFDPRWATPGEDGTRRLAEAIYGERSFDRLPQLADALQKTGCRLPAVLNHLRGPGPHARGCWALDLVLAKGSGGR